MTALDRAASLVHDNTCRDNQHDGPESGYPCVELAREVLKAGQPKPHTITTVEDIPEAVRELVREATHAGVANALMDFSDWVTLLRNNPARTPMSALTDPVADEFMITRRDLVEAVLTAQPAISAEQVESAWEEWSHFNWTDEIDMDLFRAAFMAGTRAAGLTVAGESQ